MSLSITALSTVNSALPSNMNPHSTREKETNALGKAMASGDLAAAQAAYTQLTTDPVTGLPIQPKGGLAAVGQALNSGNLAGAQQAFSDMKTRRQAREQDGQGTSPVANTSALPPGAATATAGSLLNLVA